MHETDGFTCAGIVHHAGLNLTFARVRDYRSIHAYGAGPFAKLKMPPLPDSAGMYLWTVDGAVVYVGQTRGTLRNRLGPVGYSTIYEYNTLAREHGRTTVASRRTAVSTL